MKRLDWYIAQHVLGAIFIILLIIVGLDLVFEFVDEADKLSDTYTLPVVLQYLLLRVPARLYEFIPIGSLIGCLVGLGMLASHSELTVMRAAGVSTGRIVAAVLKPALALAIFSMAMGEYLVPVAEQQAQSQRALAQSGGQALRSSGGVWHREDNVFIHINAVIPDGRIQGVTRFEFDDQGRMLRSSFAESGRFADTSWQLENVRTTQFHEQRTQVATAETESWQTGLTPTLLSVVVVEPVDLSISGLWSFSSYLSEQGLSADSYILAFWGKLLQPLSILALVLIGISFIFGPLRSVTVGQRVIAGVITGLIFKFSQDRWGLPAPCLACRHSWLWRYRSWCVC